MDWLTALWGRVKRFLERLFGKEGNMGALCVSQYPILVEFIHNDVVDHIYTDDFGEIPVYIIRSIHYLNRTTETWDFQVQDERGYTWTGTIQPGMDGTLNIPKPRQFDSAPMAFGLTFVRA